jgi:NADH:ubiquinone oxidoreductase subunit H
MKPSLTFTATIDHEEGKTTKITKITWVSQPIFAFVVFVILFLFVVNREPLDYQL